MEKWKWNPANWRSDGFAATKLRNTLLFSLLEVKMNVFRRRNFDISSSYFRKFSPSANIYKQSFLLTRFFTKPSKILIRNFQKASKIRIRKNVDKILIRIPYKNSYKHYFKFPDLKIKGLEENPFIWVTLHIRYSSRWSG